MIYSARRFYRMLEILLDFRNADSIRGVPRNRRFVPKFNSCIVITAGTKCARPVRRHFSSLRAVSRALASIEFNLLAEKELKCNLIPLKEFLFSSATPLRTKPLRSAAIARWLAHDEWKRPATTGDRSNVCNLLVAELNETRIIFMQIAIRSNNLFISHFHSFFSVRRR